MSLDLLVKRFSNVWGLVLRIGDMADIMSVISENSVSMAIDSVDILDTI